jgi:plastocyanin
VPPTATSPPPLTSPLLPPAPTPVPSGGAQSLFLTAQGLKFAPTTLYAVAGGTVTITLSNQDNFVPHNFSFTGYGTSATCTGVCTTALTFRTPERGSHGFLCTIHPYMTGTLVVQ